MTEREDKRHMFVEGLRHVTTAELLAELGKRVGLVDAAIRDTKDPAGKLSEVSAFFAIDMLFNGQPPLTDTEIARGQELAAQLDATSPEPGSSA